MTKTEDLMQEAFEKKLHNCYSCRFGSKDILDPKEVYCLLGRFRPDNPLAECESWRRYET